MDPYKAPYAQKTKARTAGRGHAGADIFLGLSAAGVVSQGHGRLDGGKAHHLRHGQPDPEITPEDVQSVRSDAIMATGRSDYPNQINNVLCFPFIFRGALDVQATTINDAMKIAAAEAIAELARAEVPDQVMAAFHGERPTFGPGYIIPAPFDPRLISHVPAAVAKAAMDSGVARKPIVDLDAYVSRSKGRLDPVAGWLQSTFDKVRSEPKRVVFTEGEDSAVIRAAHTFYNQGFGQPIIIGTKEIVTQRFREAGVPLRSDYELIDTRTSQHVEEFTELLYARLQRRGYLKRDCRASSPTSETSSAR